MAKATTPELRDPRVYWADYGNRIEAYDRPASREDAVRLAFARKEPTVAGGGGFLWHVTSTESDRWPRSERTKRAARASVERIARRILRKREAGTDLRCGDCGAYADVLPDGLCARCSWQSVVIVEAPL